MKFLHLAGKCVFASLFLVAGVGHFVSSGFFVRIMPPYLPLQRELVYLSGAFEIGLGLLLFFPRTTRVAAWGLIALLIAIFPANIYMYQHREMFHVAPLVLLLRLPVQAVLILWAWIYTRSRPTKLRAQPTGSN
jgi:uncharacterized membrane protein